ncbi:MAG: VWA domain-containing protein [Spirochaetes bacterium]|nr:VWA domain-containing protein [Spirochaetota bacterium]MBU1080636.1 VWA domain-containing protein [Spirochaetota bacterium]
MLIDTSLSMADAIEAAKSYAASDIIGRLVVPGDWVAILRFYGKTELVWQGGISGEPDIAAIVRSLNELKADGRFTDIGSALDDMDKLIADRGHPDRPKYILLLTDERQEAPKGSSYYSPTYEARHPLLEYVKKVDMGRFRVITIGYGLSARVELEARSLMTTLTEPPARTDAPLAGGSGASRDGAGAQDSALGSAQDSALGSAQGADGSTEASTQEAVADSGSGGAAAAPGTKQARGFSGAPLAAGLAAAGALGVVVAVLVARRRRRKNEDDRQSPTEPSP